MYRIDPARTDLVAEFEASPGGPHSPELMLVVNRLRLMPLADRHVLVCTSRGRQWRLAMLPKDRGASAQTLEDQIFDDYDDAVREVFRRRWKTVTGQDPDTPRTV